MGYDEKDMLRQLADPKTQRKAFEKVVSQYGQTLYWKIRRIVLNHDDADDVLQNTFVKAWINLSDFRGQSRISTWLYRIAYNVFYDYTRSHKITEEIDQAVALRQANSGDTALQLDLQQAQSILSPAERSCITLQLMEGQPIDKISEITEMAEGTVKSHLSRGKQKLAMFLRKNGYS